jgi:hypothetical protein
LFPLTIGTHTRKRGTYPRQLTPSSRTRTSGRRRNCPGFPLALQKLIGIGGRSVDELTLWSEDEVRVVYFDVTHLFADGREYLKQVAASAKPPATDDLRRRASREAMRAHLDTL